MAEMVVKAVTDDLWMTEGGNKTVRTVYLSEPSWVNVVRELEREVRITGPVSSLAWFKPGAKVIVTIAPDPSGESLLATT